MVYLSYLPVDKSQFYQPIYNAAINGEDYVSPTETSEPEKGWWKKELDRRRGRNRPRTTMSLDEFMNDMKKR